MGNEYDDGWQEKCLISIARQGGSDVKFQGLTETVDIDLGEKDIEGVALVNGGRMLKVSPETDTTVTFEAYPLEMGTASGTTGKGFFDLLNGTDASQPLSMTSTHTRTKCRVALMWTNDSTATDAAAATTGNAAGARFVFADGMITSVKPSFTDGVLKFTVNYKVPAFDKSGSANVREESTDTTGDLPALNAYTSSTKW